MIKLNKIYFILFLALSLLEVFIAKYATGFIRHTVGYFIAVLFVYTLLKSFLNISVEKARQALK